MDAADRRPVAFAPSEEMVYPARIRKDQGCFHDVAADAMAKHQRGMDEKEKHRSGAAHGIDKSSPDQEHVNERDSPEHGVPKRSQLEPPSQVVAGDGSAAKGRMSRRLKPYKVYHPHTLRLILSFGAGDRFPVTRLEPNCLSGYRHEALEFLEPALHDNELRQSRSVVFRHYTGQRDHQESSVWGHVVVAI